MAEIEVEAGVPVPIKREVGRPVRNAGDLIITGNAILATKAISKRKAAKEVVEDVFAEFGFKTPEAGIDWLRKRLTIDG